MPSGGLKRVLVLGGTAEALALAARLDGLGVPVVTALAGRTPDPALPAGSVRIGGFGGAEALARWLREEGIGAVIDATHPFAAAISANALEACRMAGLPRCALVRPPWTEAPGERWLHVADHEEAAASIPEGARVFLAVGRQAVDHYRGRDDCAFVIRMIAPPDEGTPPFGTVILGKAGKSVADERALLVEHRIDCLVSKNSGGRAAHGKIEAARGLAVPVVMIARPPPPDGPCVGTVEAACAWLREAYS